ncbi:hypothetical protein C9374_004075 [Naegleria lovaniensis]|uniref:Uncharacterized protein n=1 Tax=Naegleria lovaniensis TaxID=51637 RepID=A0AA88KIZ8_NAELO|nr:uncharacterized protein C9374_004075 [Naegleria lovaniensis]KAG2383404.1 hypothetical protein C9374_004075 [Naegleria lovaniensis]
MATRNQRSQSKYKPPVKSNPLLDGLQFAPIARNLQVSSIYILFICGFTALVMIPTDPIWLSYIPGAYCILLSFVLYVWCFVSEFNKEDKLTVEEILNPKQWPQPLRKVLSAMNRNEVQCVLCFL